MKHKSTVFKKIFKGNCEICDVMLNVKCHSIFIYNLIRDLNYK